MTYKGPATIGVWGERDPTQRCDAYAPTVISLIHPDGRLGVIASAPGDGPCMGDGHYLCVECYELSRQSPQFPPTQKMK